MNQDDNDDNDDNDGALAYQQELEHQQRIIEQANLELNLMKKEGNHD